MMQETFETEISNIFTPRPDILFNYAASKNPLAFHYYDPEKLVLGKKMKDWLRFAMAWWHTLGQASGDQFGGQTRTYEWDKGDDFGHWFTYGLYGVVCGVAALFVW